jgi:hypothetical protein
MEVDDDPTPEEQAASEAPMATYLILGRSNTGKVRTHTHYVVDTVLLQLTIIIVCSQIWSGRS